MKTILLKTFSLLLITQLVTIGFATNNNIDSLKMSKKCFFDAKQELENMLSGKAPLNYEKAIFITENAYFDNQINYNNLKHILDLHEQRIKELAERNRDEKSQIFKLNSLLSKEKQIELHNKILYNWAIYTYLTDTTYFIDQKKIVYHLPYEYSFNDPYASNDWSNSQVVSLMDNKTGNCYAIASLFKIFSERLNTSADLAIAPGHIYIRHKDSNGTIYNIEPASRTFPGTGSLETITYTTDKAIETGIALRSLNLKQSVNLCLIYLGKGYEHKFHIQTDNFILQCGELALQNDKLNLNAMLLKAEVLEQRILKKQKTIAQLQTDTQFKEYENLITKLYDLGYREMPVEMKNIIISAIKHDNAPLILNNHTPQAFIKIPSNDTRYASISNGIFDEEIQDKPIEQYAHTLYNTKTKKIKNFVAKKATYNNYEIDPTVLAWNIDPQFKMYAYSSPYAAFGNNPIYYVDPTGETLKVAGDETARAQAQTALQKMTNDEVKVQADGLVVLTARNDNPDKSLSGTSLIRRLSINEKTATITLINTGKNLTNPSANGNSAIQWDPNSREGGLDEKGSRDRDPSIGLGHELIHGLINMTGIGNQDDEDVKFSDPDQNNQESPTLDFEEYNVRVMENALRDDQGITRRLIPDKASTSGFQIPEMQGGLIIPRTTNVTMPNIELKGAKHEAEPQPTKESHMNVRNL